LTGARKGIPAVAAARPDGTLLEATLGGDEVLKGLAK
jgi:hypothetical protein